MRSGMKKLINTKGVEGAPYRFYVEKGAKQAYAEKFEARGELELWEDSRTKYKIVMLRNAKITDKMLAKIAYEAPMWDAHLINASVTVAVAVKESIFGRGGSRRSTIDSMNKRYEEARKREHGNNMLDYEEIKKNLQVMPINKNTTQISIKKNVDMNLIPYYYIRMIDWNNSVGYWWCLGAFSGKKAKEWSELLNIPITKYEKQ